MCGIIGVTGRAPALPILLDGLARLEYRGYDSAGIALAATAGPVRVRAATGAGSLATLRRAVDAAFPAGTDGARAGIGHTRWATHGTPTEENAHPHADCAGEIAVVHNGIIENHAALRDELAAAGHVFASTTDSEVVAHLVEAELAASGGPRATSMPLATAVRAAISRVTGSFAVAVISAQDPELIVAARKVSPLVLATSDGSSYLASDIPALLGVASSYFVLDDDQVAEIRPERIRVTSAAGDEVVPATLDVHWDLDAAQKSGYATFMLKEIHEQPAAVADTLRGRIGEHPGALLARGGAVEGDGFAGIDPSAVSRVAFVACGSSLHAAHIARLAVESWMRLPADVEIASELRYRDPPLDRGTLVVAVSQSGETIDTLEAARMCARQDAPVIAVTNVVGSSMTRDADAVLYTRAGPEVGVAATKTFLSQIVAMDLLALRLAEHRGTLAPDRAADLLQAMAGLPGLVAKAVGRFDAYTKVAEDSVGAHNFLYIGRHAGYPVALEGALKLKEIAYLHAEGYPAGEMKHGPIALIEPGTVVVAVATRSAVWEKTMANIAEAKARGATVVAVCEDGDEETAGWADDVLWVPPTLPLLAPIVNVVPLQVLAYVLARSHGFDVDRPRNLAKTVTVE